MYQKFLFLILGSILLTISSCSSKKIQPKVSVPLGWYVAKTNTGISTIYAEEKKLGYKVLLNRRANEKDLHYIRIAESIYPLKHTIKAKKQAFSLQKKKVQTQENWYFERVWWLEIYKDKKIPFSLTADAVNEYLRYYKDFKKKLKQQRLFTKEYGSNKSRVDLKYTTKVLYKNNQAIVVQKMHWYEYCGLPCGWGFEIERRITFLSPTQVIRIEGDDAPLKWISNKKNPYGKEWVTF